MYEAADTPVDFRILEGPPIEVYLQTMQANEVPPPATASGSAEPRPGDDDNVQMSGQQIFVLSRKLKQGMSLFERRTNKDKSSVGEVRFVVLGRPMICLLPSSFLRRRH